MLQGKHAKKSASLPRQVASEKVEENSAGFEWSGGMRNNKVNTKIDFVDFQTKTCFRFCFFL